MHHGATPEDVAVEAVAGEWRRKAVNVFSWASAIIYLPAMTLMLVGKAPPDGRPAHLILLAAYLSFFFSALLHRTDYRTRTWVLLAAGYLVALVHLVTIPHGPFGRALPAMLPILAIVILDARAGWTTTAFSLGLLVIGPLLQRVPGLVEILTNRAAAEPTPSNVILYQGAALMALLVGQMVLLDRFHEFLMRSLAHLRIESEERAVAYGNLQHEMQERRRLEHEVARAGDEERRRLGLDIHDGVCQQLTAALLRCEAMARRLERGELLTDEEFAALSSLLEEAIDESHSVANGLCPLEPGPEALAAALRVLSNRTPGAAGCPCLFTATDDVSVPDPVTAQHLYRIAQEAVSNAVRHANATKIDVRLRDDEDALVLEVEDNGKGMPSIAPTEGMGLRAMAYRAHLLEGELKVVPVPSGGTRILCRVPAGNRSNEPPDAQ